MRNAKAYLAALLLALATAGCDELKRPDPNPAVGSGLAKVEVNVDNAAGRVEAAKPHSDGTGKQLLDNASADLSGAKAELAKTEAAQRAASEAFNKLANDNQKIQDDLKNERNHWAGYKLRVAVKWVVGVALTVWLVLGACGVLFNVYGGASLAAVGTQLLHLLPVSNPFAWAGARLRQRGTGGSNPS